MHLGTVKIHMGLIDLDFNFIINFFYQTELHLFICIICLYVYWLLIIVAVNYRYNRCNRYKYRFNHIEEPYCPRMKAVVCYHPYYYDTSRLKATLPSSPLQSRKCIEWKIFIIIYFHFLRDISIGTLEFITGFQLEWLFSRMLRMRGTRPTWCQQTEYAQHKTWDWNRMPVHINAN